MSAGNNTSLGPPSFMNNDFMRLLDQLQVARFSIFSFVWVLGIWGNVMVITTICTTKRLRSSSNYFIANLAVADMGALCISMPMAVMGQVIDWPFGEIVCRFLNPLKDLFLHVSFITLTAIAIDRYIHIAHPFKPHISIYKVKLIIALIWLVDYLLVPLPMGFVMKVDKHPLNGYNVCMAKWPREGQKISILVLAGFVFLSVLVTALAYLGVGVAMFGQRGRIKKRAQGQGAVMQEKALRRQLEKNAKTVKLMVVIVLVFWFTVLPLTIFGLLLELKVLTLTASEYMITLFIVLHLLFLQHCTNPIILYLLCKEMRAGFAACVQGCYGNKKYVGSPRRCSSTQVRKDSMAAKPGQQSVHMQVVNGITKMYSIDHDNKRGPTVQV